MIALKYDHVFSPTFSMKLGGSYFLSTVSQNSPLAGSNLATQWGIQNVVIPGFPVHKQHSADSVSKRSDCRWLHLQATYLSRQEY